jgi:hypothetical protein
MHFLREFQKLSNTFPGHQYLFFTDTAIEIFVHFFMLSLSLHTTFEHWKVCKDYAPHFFLTLIFNYNTFLPNRTNSQTKTHLHDLKSYPIL